MKKLTALLLVFTLFLSFMPVFAEEPSPFCVVTFHYPEGQQLWEGSYAVYQRMVLRYADTKAVIPLSAYYEDTFYATVPVEQKDRPLEVVIADEPKFTDKDETGYDYTFYTMERSAIEGLIFGDADGKARPHDTITRAEAVTLIMRFLGLDAGEDRKSGFSDVPEEAWFAPAVTKARQVGLVMGDSETLFSPERNVSREEFMVMNARALWYAELQKEPASAERPGGKDTDQISDWAVSAYATLNGLQIATWEETGEVGADGMPDTIAVFSPKQAILRHEAAQLMSFARQNYQIYPSKAAVALGFDQKMPTIDGSTSSYPFTDAVYRNLFLNGYTHPQKPAKHSKSHASYEKLIAGEVDMLFAATEPASDILALAKEQGVELELIPIAYDAMIFFTNATNPTKGLTTEQISKLYVNNAYENWNQVGGSDALLYPYCRNNDSGSHAMMEKYFLNGNEIHETIRKETTSVSMSNVLTDVMAAQTHDPVGYGLGYSIYYYFNQMDLFYATKTELKLLEIDGVAPNDETIADGTYPLSSNSYIVLRADTPSDAPARKMVEFMLTEKGQQCVDEAGFGKLRR